jgi:uncharacterized coiled-coil protein SlyX
LESVHDAAVASETQLAELRTTLAELRTALAELRTTFESASKAQLEALRFQTRSLGELSDRVAKLESPGEDKAI